MSRSTPGSTRGPTLKLVAWATLFSSVLCWHVNIAEAQYPVDQRVRMGAGQSGRMLDVNPQLYGRGYNYARPVSPLMGGNPYATGLMGRGLSLRSVSPIPSATSFRASLGSSALYEFRRDSVGVGNSPLGMGAFRQPYYDSATTAATVGLLRGFPSADTTATGSVSPLDYRLDMRLGAQRGLTSGLVDLSQPPAPSPSATASSIFGVQAPPRLLLPTEPEQPWEPRTLLEPPERAGGLIAREPRDRTQPSLSESLTTPLSAVLRGDLYPQVGLRTPNGEVQGWTGKPGLIVPPLSEGETPAAPERPIPRITDRSVLPGFEVFNDMRLALAMLSDPNAEWFDEMQAALREQPDSAGELDKLIVEDARQFLDRMLSTPLKSLSGEGASTVNDQMLKAESLMEIGHYYEAADRYEAAHLLDPINPLPLIGKGHALLAAGDYLSAAYSLLEGIERYPDVARFAFNLQSLMGGGEIIDIRRADIMKRLESRETPELRFLLGYLEYHTGDKVRGLANLERAAENPKAGPSIGRYPSLLRGES